MPTIFRSGGFRFVIWPGDHPPPHVHVFRAGAELKINLGLRGNLPHVKLNNRMSKHHENVALLVVATKNELFLRRWEDIYGKVDDN